MKKSYRLEMARKVITVVFWNILQSKITHYSSLQSHMIYQKSFQTLMKHFLLLMLKRVVLLNILVETAWEFFFFFLQRKFNIYLKQMFFF